jgi:hypothetical protein
MITILNCTIFAGAIQDAVLVQYNEKNPAILIFLPAGFGPI